MLYAILAYHVEAHVRSWTAAEDAALMADLNRVHDRLTKEGQLGPAARLDATRKAHTLRGPGDGLLLDGPFAGTKEQLLGFYVSIAPAKLRRSRRRVNCTMSIRARSTKSARSRFTFRAQRSR